MCSSSSQVLLVWALIISEFTYSLRRVVKINAGEVSRGTIAMQNSIVIYITLQICAQGYK